MCAAPGSKTFQLLEMIHQAKEPRLLPGALVQDRGSWFHIHEDIPHNRKNVILPSSFPSSKSTQESHAVCGVVEVNIENNGNFLKNCNIEETNNIISDVAKSLDSSSNIMDSNFPLHRCMRIVPHDQNSGAFFIAVLHKVSPLNVNLILLFSFWTSPFHTFHESFHIIWTTDMRYQ
uniref:SAM-dependent MTase RsmB/NOP-type domain-containing protein n=1 Tax=Arundo donax TaxID=35708 RepID=A0A0A9DWH2_ARUDO